MTPEEAQVVAFFESLPSEERTRWRRHCRHLRERPNEPEYAMESCPEPGCVELRDTYRLVARLRDTIAGPRHLAAALQISEYDARLILWDGLRPGAETERVRALLDGAP